MNATDVRKFFSDIMKEEPETSTGIAAIRTLLKCLDHDESETVQELYETLKRAIEIMRNTDYPTTAVASGSELFLRFITLAALDKEPFVQCREEMIQRGRIFLRKLTESKSKIANIAEQFLTDGLRILTHSRSRVVLEVMKKAKKGQKKFHVFVTSCSLDDSGKEMAEDLKSLKIPCTLVLDAAVAYVMETVDVVMVGAEGVMESGGIVNRLGTLTMAICAKEMKKPFYVLTESFKFARLFPLNQRDLPAGFKYPASSLDADLQSRHPLVDYTPPTYITLLFTDLGILTPSAVSDELIKLYL